MTYDETQLDGVHIITINIKIRKIIYKTYFSLDHLFNTNLVVTFMLLYMSSRAPVGQDPSLQELKGARGPRSPF